jgi:hypothetical protein
MTEGSFNRHHGKVSGIAINMALESVTLIFLVGVGATLAYIVKHLIWGDSNGLPLPPGPKGLPLLGNVNDMPLPGILECDHWLKHKDVYGPISSVTVLGQTFIIINDADIALDMLRDRAINHSARPHMVFGSNM